MGNNEKGSGNDYVAGIFWLLFAIFAIPMIVSSCDCSGERREQERIRLLTPDRDAIYEWRQRNNL